MNPKAPAILIEWPDASVWIEWSDEALTKTIRELKNGIRLDVMDSTGAIFDISNHPDGSINVTHNRNDSDAIKIKLMALARTERKFDPSELKVAKEPEAMFEAYAKQIKEAEQVGDGDAEESV